MPVLRTLQHRAHAEIPKVKGSRFFGLCAPAPDEAALRLLLDEVRATWPDATHHCWAWRGQDGTTRSSDDGEPSGTAGLPILRRLEGADLFGVAVIVVRYFGGTRLGTGGLLRAYGEAAAAILEGAVVTEAELTTPLEVRHAYADSGAVQGVLHGFGLTPRESRYEVDVHLVVDVRVEDIEEVITALRDRTAGRCQVVRESV
jgi:uncharacterized YigZ family protein